MKHPRLTPALNRVLAHIMMGKTCKMIARETNRSPRTVEIQMAQIKRRLGAKTLVEAALIAEREHLQTREKALKDIIRWAMTVIRETRR